MKRMIVCFGLSVCGTCVLIVSMAYAQRPPVPTVFIDEMTTSEVKAAVAGGKTTLVLLFGGLHENAYTVESAEFSGPDKDAAVIGKHNFEGNYEVRRVAEDLGNALAYYAFPYEPNNNQHKTFAGTVDLRDETMVALVEDIANSGIAAAHFKNVVIIGNNGGGEAALKRAGEALDAQWSKKGARVYYLPVYEAAKRELRRFLTERKDPNVPAGCRSLEKFTQCQIATDDYSRMLFLDRKYVRIDRLAPELANLVREPGMGKAIMEQYVKLAVGQINQVMAKGK